MKHGFYKFILQGICEARIVDGNVVLSIRPEDTIALKEVAEEIQGKEIEYILSNRFDTTVDNTQWQALKDREKEKAIY